MPSLWKSAACWNAKSISSFWPVWWWGWEAVLWRGGCGGPWIKHFKHPQGHQFRLHAEHLYAKSFFTGRLLIKELPEILVNVENRCSKRSLEDESHLITKESIPWMDEDNKEKWTRKLGLQRVYRFITIEIFGTQLCHSVRKWGRTLHLGKLDMITWLALAEEMCMNGTQAETGEMSVHWCLLFL